MNSLGAISAFANTTVLGTIKAYKTSISIDIKDCANNIVIKDLSGIASCDVKVADITEIWFFWNCPEQ